MGGALRAALAACGRAAHARVAAGQPRPISKDFLWLFRTSVRGLLAVALDDRERAESAYQALLPFAAQPSGAESSTPSGQRPRFSAISHATSALPGQKGTTGTRSP